MVVFLDVDGLLVGQASTVTPAPFIKVFEVKRIRRLLRSILFSSSDIEEDMARMQLKLCEPLNPMIELGLRLLHISLVNGYDSSTCRQIIGLYSDT